MSRNGAFRDNLHFGQPDDQVVLAVLLVRTVAMTPVMIDAVAREMLSS